MLVEQCQTIISQWQWPTEMVMMLVVSVMAVMLQHFPFETVLSVLSSLSRGQSMVNLVSAA